jgi:hypothetical protein
MTQWVLPLIDPDGMSAYYLSMVSMLSVLFASPYCQCYGKTKQLKGKFSSRRLRAVRWDARLQIHITLGIREDELACFLWV